MSLGSSGERGIRTPGASQHDGFQDRCNRPLYHLSFVGKTSFVFKSECKGSNFSWHVQIFCSFFCILLCRNIYKQAFQVDFSDITQQKILYSHNAAVQSVEITHLTTANSIPLTRQAKTVSFHTVSPYCYSHDGLIFLYPLSRTSDFTYKIKSHWLERKRRPFTRWKTAFCFASSGLLFGRRLDGSVRNSNFYGQTFCRKPVFCYLWHL